jgi:outer membrane protein TolC
MPRSRPAPASASWTADIWGSVRRGVRASQATAQADFALLENARLSYQSELAEDYFELHGTDGDIDLLSTTVKSYEDYLKLTQNRYKSGVASGGDVALAQTQLDTTRAQLIDLGVARAQYEHAIAILTGKPPEAVTIAAELLKTPPPAVPVAVPSALLERRPDIAAAERTVAAANEQIGIAVAATIPR